MLALDICREIGFEWGVASALHHVGAVERQLGNLTEARSYYRESLARFQALGEKRSAAYVLNMMGNLALQRDEHKRALQHYRDGLVIAQELNLAPLITAILAGLAEIIARGHDQEFALALCTFVVQHPGTEQQTRDAFQAHIQNLSAGLKGSALRRVEKQIKIWESSQTLDQVVHETLARINAVMRIS